VSIAQALVVPNYASFIRAARILGVQKSAAGCRVQALEDRLGTSLFERQTSGAFFSKRAWHFRKSTGPICETSRSYLAAKKVTAR
jgi:DNA-binding transcriptional LysR family regulator